MAGLLPRVASPDGLYPAWLHVQKVNRPESKGKDGETVADFGRALPRNIRDIRRQLERGAYGFTELVPVPIDKGGDRGFRGLSVPTVRDRVVMRAMYRAAEPRVRAMVRNSCSYGYIEGKKRAHAAEHVLSSRDAGRGRVLEADIRSFFDEVDRTRLREALAPWYAADPPFWTLLKHSIDIALADASHLEPAERAAFPEDGVGIPQGGGLSPFFANLFLWPLDKAMADADLDMVRWADDFIVLCNGEREAREAYGLAQEILEDNLGLRLHPLVERDPKAKTLITSFAKGFDFLGLRFDRNGVCPSRNKVNEFRQRVTATSREARTVRQLLHQISNRVNGWVKAYRFCSGDPADKLWRDVDDYVLTHVTKALKRLGMHIGEQDPRQAMRLLGLPEAARMAARTGAGA